MSLYLKEMWHLASRGELEGIWFWASVYAFVVCLYSVVYQMRVRRWPGTTGKLNRAAVTEFGAPALTRADREYRADASYTYTVNGNEYSGHRVSPWIVITNMPGLIGRQLDKIDASKSGSVTVYYNPGKPQKSYLVLPGRTGIGVTLILGSLLAVGFFFRFHV